MDVVFNINQFGMEGLGATLSSLVRNCSNSLELKLWFLCSELRETDKDNIRHLLRNEGYDGKTEFVDFNAKLTFGHLKSLHGDWTSYGRLLIPNIVKSDVALYLDADLVILLDVLALKEFELGGSLIGAVYGSSVNSTLDKNFFILKLNWEPDTDYFNAGVLLFNLRKWNMDNVEARWKEITEKYRDDLISHDQTLLNALCAGDFVRLPKRFNVSWYANKKKPEHSDHCIIHFVGSPKPWDLFGNFIHNGYAHWSAYNTPFWKSQYGKLTSDKLARSWSIRRSLIKNLRKRALGR